MNLRRTTLLEQCLSLACVLLMLAATAFGAGRFLGRDLGASPSAAAPLLPPPTAEQLSALGLEGARLTPVDSALWKVSADGRAKGYVIDTHHSGAHISGFAGPVPLLVYADTASRVVCVVALPNQETSDFFARASQLLTAWNGLTATEALAFAPDAVSGATYSSRAIVGNVHAALSALTAVDTPGQMAPAIGWQKTAAVVLVLLGGLVVAVWLRGRRWARVAVLLLNVGVLGFWTGQFVSLTLVRGWAVNGLPQGLVGNLAAVAVVTVAVVLPFFGRKGHYCAWVCPYGSLQELAWRLPVPKVRVGARTFRWLRRVRLGVLGVLLFLLWMGTGTALLDFEPFAAFQVSSADGPLLAFAATFVVLGLFVPRPWCNALCPVGQLLQLAEDGK